jgi:hypothetical protein
MSDLVVWAGPVDLQQAAGATVPGSKNYNWGCKGDGHPPCHEMALGLADADGRKLPNLLAHFGETLDSSKRVFLGAFSAGGTFIREMAKHPADRASIRAMHFADATYSGSYGADGKAIPNADMLDLVCATVDDPGRLIVATTSTSPNGLRPNGTQVLQATREQAEKRLGRKSDVLTDGLYGVTPAPVAAYRLGNVIFGEYELSPLYHGGHINDIGRQVWEKIIVPWDRGELGTTSGVGPGSEAENEGRSLVVPALAFVGAFAVSAAASYLAARRFRRRS